MIKNYITIAVRNLLKHKFYTLINIFGLAIGIACCLILVFYVKNELSYDKHNEKFERIYRINSHLNFGGKEYRMAFLPAPMGPSLRQEFPDVESTVRFRGRGSFLVKRPEGENITQTKAVFVDSTIFDVFTIPIVKGNKKSILSKPHTVAISETASEIYFSGEDPIGKRLVMDNNTEYEVTAVFEDMPSTNHFHYDFLLSMEGLEEAKNQIWLSNNFYTYLLLKEGVTNPDFDGKFNALIDKFVKPQIEQFMGTKFEDLAASGAVLEYWAMPLGDIHLYSKSQFEMEPNGNIQYVYIFSIIGFFVLVIACINFMNLSTARSSMRSKEVGIRKVLGSFRSQIILQFLSEAFVITAISFLISILLIELFLPLFNELSGQSINIEYFNDPVILISMLAILSVVGLLSGSYPAFFLSSFKPVAVLRGKLKSAGRTGGLRKFLVVVQFGISIALVIGAMVITNQLRYIQNYELGFEKDQVIIIQDAYALGDQLNSFRNEISQFSEVKSVSKSSYLPVNFSARSDNAFWPEGMDVTPENSVSLQNWRIDEEYLGTMGMDLLEGRNFSLDRPTDSLAVILNERAVELFGFENPIGEKIITMNLPQDGKPDFSNLLEYEVVGVVKNFNFDSFKSNINALGMFNLPSDGFLSVKVKGNNIINTVDMIESKWTDIVSDQPFSYSFLDDRFNEMYQSEEKVAKLVGLFAALAIFIACLGLFALAAFTAEQRTKEIGVRKVLGASIWDVVLLLTGEFNKLVLISFVIAAPLAWYGMELWLEDFVYRTDISWLSIGLAGLISFFIAWVTMSYQSVKAGMSDPVESLRYE